MQELAFWVSPGRGEIRPVTVPEPGPGQVLVRTLRSGVSRGTETLVFRGAVPPDQHERMRAPHQDGDFPGPVKYGYLNVGVVEAGPSGAARQDRVLPAPAPDGVRRPGHGRDRGAGGRPRRPGGARRDRRDRGQRALGRRAHGRRPGHRGRCRDGRLLRGAAAVRDPRRRGHPGRRRPDPGRGGRLPGRRVRPSLRGEGRTRPRRARERHRGRAAAARSSCWHRTGRSSTSAGTATPRSGWTSAAPSTPGGCGCAPARSARWPCRRRHRRTRGERLALALDLLRDPAYDALFTGASAFAELPELMADLSTGRRAALCHTITYPTTDTDRES